MAAAKPVNSPKDPKAEKQTKKDYEVLTPSKSKLKVKEL